jgi:hypothetical protein
LTAAITSGVTTVPFTTGSSSNKALIGWKCTGATFTVDKSQRTSTQSTATPVTGSTGTLGSAGGIAFSGYGYDGSPSFTPTATWSQTATTAQLVNTSTCSQSVQYLDLAATTALNPSPTLGASALCGASIVVFSYTALTPPVNTVAPVISGTTTVGKTLSSTAGTWTDGGSGVKTYQWQHADNVGFTVNVANSTNPGNTSTYIVATAENTKYMRVTVTDTNGAGATPANSNILGPIGPLFMPTLNDGKIDVCANALTGANFTPGDPPAGSASNEMMLMGVG